MLIPLSLFISALVVATAADDRFPHPDRIRFDKRCIQIEGKDVFIYGGSFHYFRVPKQLWADRFRKMKDAGFNTVETYVPWNYHERVAPAGPDDFSKIDLSELTEWIKMADSFGFQIIIRPGPYICAEWAGGGYPQWLVTLFKPADWPAGKQWLQTDDPAYQKWSDHWVGAVAKVVAPFQITRRKPGETGVILFQIENEYERVNWLPKSVKRHNLESLAEVSRRNGIDVPLVSCWTTETRNVKSGPLAGVFDFINQYPKWDVRKQLDKYVERQLKDQPNAPLGAMELQGGWYSAIGGKLSREQDGVAPVQTQNLTLYALQKGFSIINYYMLVSGTNFDDWASREATTTYDFAAAIGETGDVGERYRRMAGIGAFLKDHGAGLIRSELIEAKSTTGDPAVEIVVRKAADGSRFIFIRTEDRSGAHRGKATLELPNERPLAFNYELEPFGSQVLYLPAKAADASAGTWFPKVAPEPARPAAELPAAVAINDIFRFADPLPETWAELAPGEFLEARGYVDYHPLYFRVRPAAGAEFTVQRIGDKVVKSTLADTVLARAGNRLLSPVREDREGVTFRMPDDADEVIILQENAGLHHHTTPELEPLWALGLRKVISNGKALPLAFASTERTRGLAGSLPDASRSGWSPAKLGEPAPDALLTWHRLEFELSAAKQGVSVSWLLHLAATGNGFIYLNGNCLGRTWQVGPQRNFFLPGNWLRCGAGQKNVVLVSLLPLDEGAKITEASVVPASEFAESH